MHLLLLSIVAVALVVIAILFVAFALFGLPKEIEVQRNWSILLARPFKRRRASWLVAAFVVLFGGVAVAQYASKNYLKQGGAEWDVGAKLYVNPTGTEEVQAGGKLLLDKSAVTANSGDSYAVTASGADVTVTTDSLSTAAGGSQTITITDPLATASSGVSVTLNGGTNSAGTPIVKAVPGAGTVTLTIQNAHASAAFNGTLVYDVLIH